MHKELQISSPKFLKYGRVLVEYDCSILVEDMLELITPPPQGAAYVPSFGPFEQLQVCRDFSNHAFGGMPIQIGYCVGSNDSMESVEYHRSNEISVFATDTIIAVGHLWDVENHMYDADKMELFRVPAGGVVELYTTTLHNRPINALGQKMFFSAVVLPKQTNMPYSLSNPISAEDDYVRGRNKWVIPLVKRKVINHCPNCVSEKH